MMHICNLFVGILMHFEASETLWDIISKMSLIMEWNSDNMKHKQVYITGLQKCPGVSVIPKAVYLLHHSKKLIL